MKDFKKIAEKENVIVAGRNVRLDIYRGLAIILVAFGHAVQSRVADFDSNMVFKAIYMFHMPLFFYICGMVYGIKSQVLYPAEFGGAIKRRAVQLLLPFLAWYIVNWLNADNGVGLVDRLKLLYHNPDNGLWFLLVLFFANVLADIGKLVHTKYKVRYWGVLAVLVVVVWLDSRHSHVLGKSLLAIHLPFFFFGIFHRTFVEKLGKLRFICGGALILAFPFMLASWERNRLFVAGMAPQKSLTLPISPLLKVMYLFFGVAANALCAISGMVIFFLLVNVLIRSETSFAQKIKTYLTFIGTRTLEIYAIHFFFIGTKITGSLLLDSTFAVISAISLSIVIAEFLIKPIAPLSLLLLGRWR